MDTSPQDKKPPLEGDPPSSTPPTGNDNKLLPQIPADTMRVLPQTPPGSSQPLASPSSVHQASSSESPSRHRGESTTRRPGLPNNFPYTPAPPYEPPRSSEPGPSSSARSHRVNPPAASYDSAVQPLDDPFDPSRLIAPVAQYPRLTPVTGLSEKRIPYFDQSLPGLGYTPNDLPHGGQELYPAISATSSESTAYESAQRYHRGSNASESAHLVRPRAGSEAQKPVEVSFNVTMRCPPEDTRDYSGFALSSHRMLALREVDNATFSWFHFRVCLIAGVGFFTDAYDIFSINIASTMLQFVYAGSVGGNIEQAAVKAAAPLGTLIGQLVFGWLADKIGRKRMYGIELIIIIIGTFGQSLAANGDIGTVNIFSVLIVWRFIMGLGIGGDYPLSAVISSEFASTHIRGRMLTAVFANQGWGQFASTLVATAVVSAFQRSFTTTQLGASLTDPLAKAHLMRAIDRAWRVLVGFGCVPAAAALWFRLTIPETPRFTMDVERNVQQAIADIDEFIKTGAYAFDPDSVVVRVVAPRATWKDFRQWFGRWEEAKVLLGCAYAWFAIDVIFYGLGLNTTKFFTAIGFSSPLTCNTLQADSTAHQAFTDFQNLIIANMVLSAAGLIPGYWATFLFIDRLGRKRIQLLGFGMLTVLFVGMGSSFSTLLKGIPQCVKDTSLFAIPRGAKGFLSLFILASFFQNFGPNTTTFVIPAENFPTRYRSTCHGICAASGKIGAIVSQFAFESVHARNILFAYIPFSVTGFLATLLVRETKQMSLENIHGEESDRFISGLVRPHPGSKVTHHYATSSV